MRRKEKKNRQEKKSDIGHPRFELPPPPPKATERYGDRERNDKTTLWLVLTLQFILCVFTPADRVTDSCSHLGAGWRDSYNTLQDGLGSIKCEISRDEAYKKEKRWRRDGGNLPLSFVFVYVFGFGYIFVRVCACVCHF